MFSSHQWRQAWCVMHLFSFLLKLRERNFLLCTDSAPYAPFHAPLLSHQGKTRSRSLPRHTNGVTVTAPTVVSSQYWHQQSLVTIQISTITQKLYQLVTILICHLIRIQELTVKTDAHCQRTSQTPKKKCIRQVQRPITLSRNKLDTKSLCDHNSLSK